MNYDHLLEQIHWWLAVPLLCVGALITGVGGRGGGTHDMLYMLGWMWLGVALVIASIVVLALLVAAQLVLSRRRV
ncbi:MAG: hypothetical protein V4474_04430 [Patescibacteria group bacterium]